MAEEFDPRSLEILQKLGLTGDTVRDHVIRPENLDDAAQLELHDAGDVTDPPDRPDSGLLYRLDVDGLRRDLQALLSPCLSGYALQLRRYGKVLIDQRKDQARTEDDGRVDWGPDVQMHVASVSKLVTAMAMTKLLHDHGISIDARIAWWLPTHWVRGPGVDKITFRQLLTHTSGLVAKDEAGPADYQSMKDQIAIGVVGGVGYRNMNYSLCRILISTIDAPYLFALQSGNVNDKYWDTTTINYYTRYVEENVFDPVGVTSAFPLTAAHALAYPFPIGGTRGSDSGDLSTMSGAVGWRLSVDDLLAIMAAFRRLGTIVDPAHAQAMLDRRIGLDWWQDTPLGRIYAKGGFWSFPKGNIIGFSVQQTNAFFLPKGMELVILANSPLCQPNTNFMDQVYSAIVRNIQIRRDVIAVAATAVVAVAGLLRYTRGRHRP
jgi:CubicO group peptidase (beta-lactamase class C family)